MSFLVAIKEEISKRNRQNYRIPYIKIVAYAIWNLFQKDSKDAFFSFNIQDREVLNVKTNSN